MLRRHIEGLIIVPAPGKSHLRDPEFEQTPIVTLDRPVRGSSFDSVVVQNKRGAQLGVQHLIEHHHRRITCLGLAGKVWTKNERLEGYLAALKAAGLEPDAHTVGDIQAETLQTVRALLGRKNPPTAFFCTNNLVMRHTLNALTTLNARIPEQIAILGFDDFEMADILKPPMTVVRQPTDELGRVAAELLFSRLSDTAQNNRAKRIVLPVELVIRKSCGSHGARSSKQTAI
jgi:LacI family transcriptional regulator